ncbi:hypothetical protein [Undibacterium arcticum]|uniref:hypothetical protein n=1 Tax=Undibacterium arcticum TaxID=1762892 RepID=UPI0036F3CB78
MDTALKKLGLFSLLMASMTLAFALPLIQFGGRAENQPIQQAQRDERQVQQQAQRDERQVQQQMQREERQAQRQMQNQEERRDQNDMRRARPQAGDANMRGENGGRDAQAQQKTNRLSVEERRALRRQINEAGQDIYPNKK